MMMDAGMMGGYMVWMWVAILTIVCVFLFAIWSLLRPPKAEVIDGFNRRYGVTHAGKTNAGKAPEHGTSDPGLEERLLIVIPDISGYTRFIAKSRFALAHAHFVIQELLDAIMTSGADCFSPMRIEGDAVVFHLDALQAEPRAVGDAIVGILEAFYRKRAQLKHDNVCRCSICKNIADLDLKIIVHAGDVLRFHMGDFEDATGEAMIVAHRLLKGVSHSHRYVLVSEAAFPNIELSTDWAWTDFAHDRHGPETTSCHLAVVPDSTIDQWDQLGGSSRSISDFLSKMAALKNVSFVRS